jgi:hypothetical protein
MVAAHVFAQPFFCHQVPPLKAGHRLNDMDCGDLSPLSPFVAQPLFTSCRPARQKRLRRKRKL